MFTVYVLKSDRDGHRYVGFTSNLKRRLSEHNLGRVKSTKNRKPFQLIYKDEFESKAEAMSRENFFKSGKGREFLNSNSA